MGRRISRTEGGEEEGGAAPGMWALGTPCSRDRRRIGSKSTDILLRPDLELRGGSVMLITAP
jgi:hypothetical protein